MAIDRSVMSYFAEDYFSRSYYPDLAARETTPTTPSSPARYFSTDYFSAFYFPDLTAPGTPAPETPGLYFVPDYFSRFYFPDLAAVATVTPPPPPARSPRDRDGFEAILEALRQTGVFAQVFFGTDAAWRAGGVDLSPAAVVTPRGWTEDDSVDPIDLVRTVNYTLTLVVRGNDPAERFDLLDRLGSVAQNAIDGEPLGGVCLPALTKLRSGQFDPEAPHPEQSAVLQGEFSYLVPALDGHRVH